MSRWLARLLAVLVLVPYALLGGVQRPAQAQRLRPPLVYVLDFDNHTDVGGATLGKQAAAQVAVELNESQNWAVVPGKQVQAQILTLGYRPPFDRTARKQIGQGLDADAVVYGAVTDARVCTDPMQATVSIEVVVEDVRTGVLLNGARATGVSLPRTGFAGDADVLLEEALNKAAFRAREFMDLFRVPEGTVLNTAVVGDPNQRNPEIRALVNIRARQGVRPGQDFVITRYRELVAFGQVVSVAANLCKMKITNNLQGVKPEDRVRGIFDFQALKRGKVERKTGSASPTAPAKAEQQAKAAPAAKPALLALADDRGGKFEPMVAAQPKDGNEPLIRGNGEDEEGVYGADQVVVDQPHSGSHRKHPFVSGAAAKLLAGGALLAGILWLGGTRGNDIRSFDVTAQAFQSDGVGSPGTGIKVSWKRPKGVPGTHAGPNNPGPFGGIRGYTIWRLDGTGIGISEVVGSTLGDIREFIDTRFFVHTDTFIWQPPYAPGDTPGEPATLANIPGLVAGHRYRYQSQAVYFTAQDLDGDGTPDDITLNAPLSQFSNPATAIVPGEILDPAQGQAVDLANLTVRFTTTPGADKYQVLVSSDTGFANARTFRCFPITVVPPDHGGPTEATVTCDAAVPRVVGPGNQSFITVIAWTSIDPLRPAPYGGISYPPIGVTLQVTPPPASPGSPGLGKGKGGNGANGSHSPAGAKAHKGK